MFRLELKYQNLTIREYRFLDGDTRLIGETIDISQVGISIYCKVQHCPVRVFAFRIFF